MPSEEQLIEYKEAFSLFDKQGNGTVDSSSIGDLLRAVGQNPTQADVVELIKSIQQPITFDLFLSDILKRNGEKGFQPPGTAEEFIQGFQVFDKDGSGLISSGELRYVLTSLGDKLSEGEVDELLKWVEVDKQGYVNYEEFVKMVMGG